MLELVSTIKGTVTDIIDLAKKGAFLEVQTKVVELLETNLECREKNTKLGERVAELESALKLSREVKFEEGKYWRHQDGGAKDGPFCQLCYDKSGLLIRLQVMSIHASQVQTAWNGFTCLNCQNAFP